MNVEYSLVQTFHLLKPYKILVCMHPRIKTLALCCVNWIKLLLLSLQGEETKLSGSVSMEQLMYIERP